MSIYDNGDMESEDYARADFEAEMNEQRSARETAEVESWTSDEGRCPGCDYFLCRCAQHPIYPGDRNGYRVLGDGSYREDFHSDG